MPRTKAQILELLRTEGEKFAQAFEGVSEAFLAERVESRFEMLIAPKKHEMHHRGQLMVIERVLGMTPHRTRHLEGGSRRCRRRERAGSHQGVARAPTSAHRRSGTASGIRPLPVTAAAPLLAMLQLRTVGTLHSTPPIAGAVFFIR